MRSADVTRPWQARQSSATNNPHTQCIPTQIPTGAVRRLVNRQQADTIAYLVEENRVLKERLGKRQLRLTAKGETLGRRLLGRVATIAPRP